MTIAKIQIVCGCGFRTDELAEAGRHAEFTGHVMNIHGSVRADAVLDARLISRGRQEIARRELHNHLSSWAASHPDAFKGGKNDSH